MKEHKGTYAELKWGTPFLPFTSLHFSQSFSESKTSRYTYGPQAVSGPGYFSAGLTAFIPFVPWPGRIIMSLKRSVITQGRARHADLVRGDYKNDVFAFRAIWDVY